MPAFVAALLGGLINIAGTLAGQVLIGLGISVVTYTGVDTSLGWLKTQALANITSLPPGLPALLSFMKVGVCISILSSAMVARMTLNGFTGGTFKRWVNK